MKGPGGWWLDAGMNRREFLGATAGVAMAGAAGLDAMSTDGGAVRAGFVQEGNRIRIRSPRIRRGARVFMVGDTHLFRDDGRGESFRQYSGRMAKAYNRTKHFESGHETDPERCFVEVLGRAKSAGADCVALIGDLLSFPSEAAVEWVGGRLAEAAVPHVYTAGNHDWHYEGMEGSLETLRETWIRRRLLPLYGGADPMMSVRDVGDVRLVLLDNSTYEISRAQLAFFRAQVRTGRPLVLLVHIPLYVPGRPLGFGCGHPQWGAANDKGYELERRRRWRPGGHTAVTRAFHAEVFRVPNLLGVFAGHVHRAGTDIVDGVPQFVTDANATGAYLEVEFLGG